MQGQTGKFFFVVQAGTFALKIPAVTCAKDGQPDQPEQTVQRHSLGLACDSLSAVVDAECPSFRSRCGFTAPTWLTFRHSVVISTQSQKRETGRGVGGWSYWPNDCIRNDRANTCLLHYLKESVSARIDMMISPAFALRWVSGCRSPRPLRTTQGCSLHRQAMSLEISGICAFS